MFPPNIGRTCTFDTKIGLFLMALFGLTHCQICGKKKFEFFDFCFQIAAEIIEIAFFLKNRPKPVFQPENCVFKCRFCLFPL